MTGICDIYLIIKGNLSAKKHLFNLFFQFCNSFFFFCRNRNYRMSCFFFQDFRLDFRLKISFIIQDNSLFSSKHFHDFFIIFVKRNRRIHYIKNQICFLCHFSCSVYPYFFHNILCFPDSGCINNLQGYSMKCDIFLQNVSGRSCNICHNSPIFSDQKI